MENETTIRIEFNEQQKAVTANVRYEVKGTNLIAQDLLEEAKKLFEQAKAYTTTQTMNKVHR